MAKVAVTNADGKVIAQVKVNTNLDFWDGHNWTCGSSGHHMGITQLQDGTYVLIHSSQWQGERNTAEVITADEAIEYIVGHGHDELLDKYGLRTLAEKTLIAEKEDE